MFKSRKNAEVAKNTGEVLLKPKPSTQELKTDKPPVPTRKQSQQVKVGQVLGNVDLGLSS